MELLKKEFEQKNRKRAIHITDIAISKVPRTHIPGFSEEQNIYIQELHKIALKKAQKLNIIYKTNQMEVGILVDIHSWEHWIVEGRRPREVEVKHNIVVYKRLVSSYKNQLMFIHNHPSTGTFSAEDFKMFCYHTSLYMMTVVGNDSAVYILMKTPTFHADKAIADYMHLSMKYLKEGYINNNGTLAIKELLKNAAEYGLVYKKGRNSI